MHDCDLVIVGGGPAGLSAALSASSERIRTVLIESKSELGGQARGSTSIENYVGFPHGISGSDLMDAATQQVYEFGTEVKTETKARTITSDGHWNIVTTHENETFACKTVILSGGLSYRKLEADGVHKYVGRGVYYGMPTHIVPGAKNIYIVGGANSAGQAAVHCSHYDCNIYLVVRSGSLETSMSGYLIDRIQSIKNIHVLLETEVAKVSGSLRVNEIELRSHDGTRSVEADRVCIFIGAQPKTEWLEPIVAINERGYVLTGQDIIKQQWKEGTLDKNLWITHDTLALQTTKPGVFAVGDVRANSIKRVAAAVGEGAMVVSMIHQYLANLPTTVTVSA